MLENVGKERNAERKLRVRNYCKAGTGCLVKERLLSALELWFEKEKKVLFFFQMQAGKFAVFNVKKKK